MAEGGCLPWKVQKIDTSRGPAVSYRAIHSPLPNLPNGTSWQRDGETGEWKVVTVSTSRNDRSAVQKTKLKNAKCPSSAGDQQSSSSSQRRTTAEESALADTEETNESSSLKNEKEVPEKPREQENDPKKLPYVEHTVLPSDTMQGLCLRYRITATQLRQANRMLSGSNLLLAPSKLIIPITTEQINLWNIRLQDPNSDDYKIQSFLARLPKLRQSEARAYLELSDWDLELALAEAIEDIKWEAQQQQKQQRESVPTKNGAISSSQQQLENDKNVVQRDIADDAAVVDCAAGASGGCLPPPFLAALPGGGDNKKNNTLVTDELEMASLMMTTPLLQTKW